MIIDLTIINLIFQLLVILYFAMVETIYATRSILGDFSIEDLEESILNIFCDCLWLLPYVVTVLQMVVFCEKTTTEVSLR